VHFLSFPGQKDKLLETGKKSKNSSSAKSDSRMDQMQEQGRETFPKLHKQPAQESKKPSPPKEKVDII